MISMDVLTCALAGVVTSSLAALPSVLILRRVRRLERQHQPNRRLDDDSSRRDGDLRRLRTAHEDVLDRKPTQSQAALYAS